MRAEHTRLQCRGNETQPSELRTAAAADNKLCSFVKFRGTNKKQHMRFSAGYRKMGFTCSAILYFYSAELIAGFICHGCLRHSRQGRVILQKDDLETRQSQFWQYHGAYISRFSVWIIISFQLLSTCLLAAPPYLCTCKSLKKWKAIPGPNAKQKPINIAHMCPQPKMKAVFTNQHLTLLLRAPFWSLQ